MNETPPPEPQHSLTFLEHLASEPAAFCPTLDSLTAKLYQPSKTSIPAYQRAMRNEYKGAIVMPAERVISFDPPVRPPTTSESSNLGRYLLGQYTYPTSIDISADEVLKPHSPQENTEILAVNSQEDTENLAVGDQQDGEPVVRAETISISGLVGNDEPVEVVKASITMPQIEIKVVEKIKKLSQERRRSPRLERMQPVNYKTLGRVGKEQKENQTSKPISKRASQSLPIKTERVRPPPEKLVVSRVK